MTGLFAPLGGQFGDPIAILSLILILHGLIEYSVLSLPLLALIVTFDGPLILSDLLLPLPLERTLDETWVMGWEISEKIGFLGQMQHSRAMTVLVVAGSSFVIKSISAMAAMFCDGG
ncbi:hypothetical protein QBC43DRAFT_290013 [Cladorrhinum sp. PSN259]|nr:hypothetical protein QBC43DRAFT_290013 [Cladorrhinum sp. PSN259]